ncbi:MFS transporter [Neobacillus sp. Marseille-QA0830]
MKKNLCFKTLYTLFVFIILAAFEHIIIGLFPPLFQYIADDLKIDFSKLGFISGANILVTALSSIVWGYLSGKFKRKILIVIGTVIWVVSIFLTSISESYLQLLWFQMMTGLGLGCLASIGFSVLTDCIPYHKRGLVLSLWGMAQGLGGIIGAGMVSLTGASHSWRWSFETVGFIGLFLILLILFVDEPARGAADPELQTNGVYHFKIEANQVKKLLLKGSNLYLFFQAFFFNITTGSMIWIPSLYVYKMIQQGYKMETAVMASGIFFALFQLGGMTSAWFGQLGDKAQRKNGKGRANLTAFFVILTMPLYMIFFFLPMDGLMLPVTKNPLVMLMAILKQNIVNPWMLVSFLLAFAASAAQSANTPNWLALITNVNLPEHRGIAFSVANLFNSLGRTIGNMGVGILLGMFSPQFKEPLSFIVTLVLLQVFLIPSAFCYLKMGKSNMTDIDHVKRTLKERAG